MRTKIFALAFTALAVTACDKTTDPSTSLTPAEARAIALAIDNAGMAAVDARASDGASRNLTPTRPSTDLLEHSGDFSFSGACDLGGLAALTGDGFWKIDSDAGTIEFGVTATADYSACAFKTNNNVEIELDGIVDFAADRLLDFQQGLATGSQSYEGSLAYVTSDGKEGTCLVDVSADFSLTQNNASRTVSGSVCGQSVNATTTWTKTN
jgi:hypothetical protein